MKHLKLGKIQWIALLVVSAMFVNLCSHMVLAAARDGNDPAQGTTAEATTASEATTEATTASEATTETTTEQQEETQSMGEYKAFWFLSTIMTLIVQNIKRERQQISVPTLQVLSKRKESWNESRDCASKTIWRCHL